MYSYPQSIYHSMILPKLDYCSAIWDLHHPNDITALDRVQRFAGRVITHFAAHKLLHTPMALRPLHFTELPKLAASPELQEVN